MIVPMWFATCAADSSGERDGRRQAFSARTSSEWWFRVVPFQLPDGQRSTTQADSHVVRLHQRRVRAPLGLTFAAQLTENNPAQPSSQADLTVYGFEVILPAALVTLASRRRLTLADKPNPRVAC